MENRIVKEKTEQKRLALLRATLELINNRGFHNAPMSKIARMAKVSVGTIYLYFDNKQDLVNKLYLEVRKNFASYIYEGIDETMEIKEQLRYVWKRMVKYKLDYPKEISFMLQCDVAPIVSNSEFRQGLVEYSRPILDIFDKGIETKVIKNISKYIIYAFFIHPISIIYDTVIMSKVDIQQYSLDEVFEMAWDGIKYE